MQNVIKQFNTCATDYALARPTYPPELFEWIHSVTPQHKEALDCGTGNGQAAIALTKYFNHVVAIDRHPKQLANAPHHPQVNYRCMPAEEITLKNNSVDLITAACSVHWFDLNSFYLQCKRIMRPNARIILWTYTWPITVDSIINTILQAAKNKLNGFWSEGSLLHLNEYRQLPFPFQSIQTPQFSIQRHWSIEQFIHFLSTWACILQYQSEIDANYLFQLHEELLPQWHDTDTKLFLFPLHIKAGYLGAHLE